MNTKTIGINFSNGQYYVPSAMRNKTPKEIKPKAKTGKTKNARLIVDDISSDISNASSAMVKAIADRRVSIRVRGEDMIESYMGIEFLSKQGGIKDQTIADQANPVSAPPVFRLDRSNNPNLKSYFDSWCCGTKPIKVIAAESLASLFNTQDRPRDIHRTILLNDPCVGGLQFDAARKPKRLLRTLRDGAQSTVAFFKANYILKQKIVELNMKKRLGVSYYSPVHERREDLAILKEDLIMTGVIPENLQMRQKKVKNRLANTGYLAFRLHVSLQNPHWLAPDTDKMRHMEKFMHFNIPRPLSLSKEASGKSYQPFFPEPFEKPESSNKSSPMSRSLSRSTHRSRGLSTLSRSGQSGSKPQDDMPVMELTETPDE